MIRLWAVEGDLLTAISSSGQSENILNSAATARALGCRVLTYSGFREDNPLRAMGDVNFYVRSESYGVVEVGHSFLAHMCTDLAKASSVTA
jgi:D-sedoheptulose 7-phosphate isomerase